MGEDIIRWFVGLVIVSGVVGHYVTRWFSDTLKSRTESRDEKLPWDEVPRWLRRTLIGVMERVFFTIAIGGGLSGTAIAMIAWTALKAANYWVNYDKLEGYQTRILVALLSNLMSLFWAMLGGLICMYDPIN